MLKKFGMDKSNSFYNQFVSGFKLVSSLKYLMATQPDMMPVVSLTEKVKQFPNKRSLMENEGRNTRKLITFPG